MSVYAASASEVSIAALRRMKREGRPIAALTAYDASFARVVDAAGMDIVLVGDTLGQVIQGQDTTLPVSVDDMIYHGRAVRRGLSHALLMVDMPFMSFATPADAVVNAGRLMKESGARMVKLEGGAAQVETVRRLSECGIPVCAHLGLKPQSVHKIGGYRVQGRDDASARAIGADARALEAAGADVVLVECVPAALARDIAEDLDAPVIGIGSGAGCDGQILVLQDALGITPDPPSFAPDFLTGAAGIQGAIEHYVQCVREHRFPAAEHAVG